MRPTAAAPAAALAAAVAAALATGTAATAEVPAVVTDTPVVHSLVSKVMGNLGEPTVLLEPGADPHAFQLRPSQAAALSEAALVFWVGEELTPWLARALGTLSAEAEAVALLHAEGVSLMAFGDGAQAHDDHGHDHAEADDDDHGHDHAEAHDHDHGHDHAEAHDHAHDGIDPHAWLDPANAKAWTAAIAAHLAEADPANAATYAANAEAAIGAIDAAAAEAVATLAAAQGQPIVVFHDAYGYFSRAFGLEIAGSIALGDAAAPGAQRLRALQETMGDDRIACVFREPQHDDSLARSIAADASVGLGTLDPEGTTLTYGPELYTTLLTTMATAIAECVATSG